MVNWVTVTTRSLVPNDAPTRKQARLDVMKGYFNQNIEMLMVLIDVQQIPTYLMIERQKGGLNQSIWTNSKTITLKAGFKDILP